MIGSRQVVVFLALVAAAALTTPLAAKASPGGGDMLFVYPGEAGDQASAKNTLTTFTDHLAKESGLPAFDPLYFNNLKAANAYFANGGSPRCAILALSVYLDWTKRGQKMALVAQSQRRGKLTEQFHLFVPVASKVKVLQDLKGSTVMANYLEDARFTNNVVFRGEASVAPLTSFVNFVSTRNPLQAAKACATGKKLAGGRSPDAVIMDDDMLDGVKELKLEVNKQETPLVGGLLREVWTSRELPTPPVVSFDALPAEAQKKLEGALTGMAKSAPEILTEIKSTGFVAPDSANYAQVVKDY
jgi:ABC-type phosphate/phosphonate transport system substrate-binding protein